jgi:hypothetical protein
VNRCLVGRLISKYNKEAMIPCISYQDLIQRYGATRIYLDISYITSISLVGWIRKNSLELSINFTLLQELGIPGKQENNGLGLVLILQ